MVNFQYYMPTQVVFGKDAENQSGVLVQEWGGKKALIHYGGSSAKSSGLLDRVMASLDQAGVAHVELGGVAPNPRLSKVQEGIELGRKEGVDFVLAIGGGSVIDSAKAIAAGLAYDGDVWDVFCSKAKVEASYPIGCVLTIAAAGSETSTSCVITSEDGWKKRAFASQLVRPKFAVLNPELTYTVPPYQTAAGCVDIIYHTIERYFSGPETVEPTDSIGEGVMRTVIDAAPRVLKNPKNYEARAAILWAGSLSQNDLTGCGKGGIGRVGDWASHQIEHELSGMFDVTHGAGLASIWGGWSRYVMPEAPARFARFARNVMSVADTGDDTQTALEGIEALERFFTSLNMPTTISQLGIELNEETIERLAWLCTFEGKRTIGSFKVLELEDIKQVYRMAK